MYTFTDLKFKPKKGFKWQKQACLLFENGYEASVLFWSMFYSNGKDTYELAILHNWKLCYDTGLTDDVFGWISKDEVTELLKKISSLPPKSWNQ